MSHTITWTDNGREGTFTLDDRDLTRSIARDGVTLTTQDGRVHADVRLLPDALDVTVESDRVTVHTTNAQERLLRAGGWAKEGDVAVNADLLWTQGEIVRLTAEHIKDDYPDAARHLLSAAARIQGYVNPQEQP